MPTDWTEFTPESGTTDWSEFTPEPTTDEKRKSLAFEKTQAGIESQQVKAAQFLADLGGGAATAIVQAASKVDPTGFFQNMMARQGILQSQLVPPEAIRGDIQIAEQFARQALGNVGLESLIPPPSVSEPIKEFAAENIASLPEIAPALALGVTQPRPVARLFQAQMAAALPQSVQAVQEAETPSEKLKAGLGVAAGVALPAAIELGLRQPIPEVPPFRGTQIPMPEGARPTPPAPLPKPTVPETVATVYETAAAEARRKGADTINKILALFPSLEGNRTKAREIRDVAFPKEKGISDASEVSPTAEVHGDVQPFAGKGVREVPVEEGGAGVQPQAQGGIPEAQAPSPAPEQRGLLLTVPEKDLVQSALDHPEREMRSFLATADDQQIPVYDTIQDAAKANPQARFHGLDVVQAERVLNGKPVVSRGEQGGPKNVLLDDAPNAIQRQFGRVTLVVDESKLKPVSGPSKTSLRLKFGTAEIEEIPREAIIGVALRKGDIKRTPLKELTPEERAAEQRALDEALGQETESTPPPKETPTAPSAAEPSSQTPATQGISEAKPIEQPAQVSTEPFLGKTKAEWTPEYYKSLSPENRRAARAQVISALRSEGGTTKVTQESKPPVVIKGIHELLDLREKKKAATPTPPTPEAGPGMVGMGGAAAGELSESAGADIYGIAQRVREQRAAAGQTPALPRGEGVSALESVQHGRRLIAADPLAAEKAADAFSKTKAVSYDGLSAVRAKGEEAFMAARNIEQKFGTDSPEYRNAFGAASRWDKVSKEMQTVWHRTGQAQQGQTDIDTGSFTGLHRAFRAATGKDFTPKQAKQAKEKVAVVQTATAEAEAATKKLFDAIDKVLPQGKAPVDAADARKQLSSFKPGAKPNLEQIRSIWSYVKSVYISRGEANLDTIAQKASDDLGIPKLDIIKAMASPKGARALTDEAFLKLQRQRQAISAAKNWLTTANLPGWERFVRKIPRFFFMTKVFGHGTVGMVTHAGSMAFDPAAMKSYWPVFLKQYGLVFSERYHARLMQELMDDPYFATARRAGLANDPFRYQDDYQNPKLAGWFGRWGLAGNRGFDSLKLLRQARWNEIWDSFPDELKTKEMAKLLADQVNHATGIVRSDVLGRFAEPAGTILFAPKLEMSRWAFAVGDPAKATRIFLSWEKATPEERMFAISEVKQKARIFGVYMGLLALNESILQASGSDQRVNFNNPNRGDFLAFKVAGQNVSVISPMLHMGALLADMIKIGFFKRKGVEKVTPRRSAAAAAIGRYAQGKLSPFAQPIADAWFQSTFENRPMPFSADRAAKWMRQRGMGRWTWPEYLSETFTPIPVSEAIREVWRSQGMNEDEMDKAAKALMVLTITGGTGVRLSQDIHRGGK